MMKTVTILVPVYGAERYIAECAESLLSQTYPAIEYVFCDDGTPDASMSELQEVVRRYADRSAHVRVIANASNRGIGATRARLMSEVRTPLFMFVDADDRLPPDAVALLVVRQHATGAEMTEGGYQTFTREGMATRALPSHATGSRQLRRMLCQNIVPNRVWGILYSTEAVRRIPRLFTEGIDYGEDYGAMARLTAVCSRTWTDGVVYYYRTDNATSATATAITPRSLRGYLRASREVLRFFQERGKVSFALEMGLLQAYRECRRFGQPYTVADEVLQYTPRHIVTRLLRRMLCGGTTCRHMATLLYRVIRRITVL